MKRLPSDDPLLLKSLQLLVHPLTLVALVLLLINDHLLRQMWPSALTGKLGDFAWLFFIPLALTAVLALVTPGRSPNRSKAVPAIAYGSAALIFTLAKTVPPANTLVVSLASAIFGFPVAWRLDPTDLLALLALGISAWIWRKTSGPLPSHADHRIPGWLALAAAVLLTVANSPAPDPGIYCLDERAGEIDAYAGYATYRSTDGGLTWAPMPNQGRGACPNPWTGNAGASLTTTDPNHKQRQYRSTPGHSIELSEDGGATWSAVYQVAEVSEANAAALRKRQSSAMLRPVPLDAKVDRATGNAVFAMGHAGVLVQEANNGVWREVAAGPYRPAAVNAPSDFLGLLLGEILLGVAMSFLGFNTLATRLVVRGKGVWFFALGVAWLIWAAVAFVARPALTSGYGVIITYGAMLVLGLILLVLTVISLVGSLQQGGPDLKIALGRPLLTSVAAGVLFVAPFALWVAGALPQYTLASVFGTALGVAAIVAGARWTAGPQDPDL